MPRRSSIDPLFDEPQGPAWGRWAIGGGIALILGFIVYAAIAGSRDTQQGPVPIIRADETAWTRAPSDPGGMDIPNQDSTVFELMDEEPVLGEPAPVDETADKAEEKPAEKSEDKAEAKTLDSIVADAMEEPAEETSTETVETETPIAEEVKAEDVKEDIAEEEKVEEPKAETAKTAKPEDEPYKPAAKTPSAEPVIGAETPKAQPASTGGRVTVRLGSVPGTDMAKAQNEFKRLQGLSGGQLSGASPSFEKVELPGKGSFVRINAGMDRSAATKLCDALSAKGAPCLILE